MPCKHGEYLSIRTQLQNLGYKAGVLVEHMLSVQLNIGHKSVSYSELAYFEGGGILMVSYFNPELFLALAAMSEGETFYPGEWGVCEYEYSTEYAKGELYRVEKELNGKVFTEPNNGHKWIYKQREAGLLNFRKATVEEIINHFPRKTYAKKYINEEPKKEEIAPGDWVVATEEAVKSGHAAGIWQVEEVTTGSELSNSHLLLTSNGYSQKSYFRKATAEDIAAHLANKDAITAERIKELFKNESMPHGLAKSIADLLIASGVTYVTDQKVEEPEWKPEFGEEVLVWDEGYKERKTYYYLGEVNNQHLCSRYKINGNRGQNIEATSWERMSSKTAKVKISLFDAQEELGKIYGVTPEQIEIV